MCIRDSYWATLAAMGTDIVGLSGNHVNDFGREGARRSLQWYRDNAIPTYGSGMNVEEACAPPLWEHNGHSFAFVAALALDPPGAWARAADAKSASRCGSIAEKRTASAQSKSASVNGRTFMSTSRSSYSGGVKAAEEARPLINGRFRHEVVSEDMHRHDARGRLRRTERW